MNKMFKATALVLSAAVMLSVAAGCNKSQVNSDDGEKVMVRMWEKPSEDANQDTKDEYAKKMELLAEKFPNVRFEDVAPVAIDYSQQYDLLLMSGEEPTFNYRFSYTDVPGRILNGTVADITEYVENWDLRKEGKVLDVLDEAIQKDGRWYGVPWQAYVRAMIYNETKLKEAGYDKGFPESWDEFTEMGRAVTDFSVPRIGYGLIGMSYCAWPFTAWVWSAGGDMVTPNGDGTYRLAFADEPGVDAAMFMNKMIWEDEMTQKDVLEDYPDYALDYKVGRTMSAWGSVDEFNPGEIEQYNINLDDFRMLPIPPKEKGGVSPAISAGEIYTFSPKASKEQVDAAWEIMNFLNYDEDYLTETWEKRAELGKPDLYIPGRQDLYEKKLQIFDKIVPKDVQEDLQALKEVAIPEPYSPNWWQIKERLVEPLQQIYLKQGITRDECRQILQDCADKIYQEFPETYKK